MRIRFWGVRGSIAVSGSRYNATGGNTSCVELTHEGHRLVLDAGTGLRALGEHLGFSPQELAICFSHVHWDHIQGFPFFAPGFHPGSELTLIGASTRAGDLRMALEQQMLPPQFPITLRQVQAKLHFRDAIPGELLQHGPFSVLPLWLDHPDPVLAFRVEAGGRSVVYATDHEHAGAITPELVELARDADLLIHDAQYTPDEAPQRRGWGHSTWDEAAEVAQQAGVRKLALFHHDPGRDDGDVAAIEAATRDRFPNSFAAREGRELCLA